MFTHKYFLRQRIWVSYPLVKMIRLVLCALRRILPKGGTARVVVFQLLRALTLFKDERRSFVSVIELVLDRMMCR
jgi:hypothetical protein